MTCLKSSRIIYFGPRNFDLSNKCIAFASENLQCLASLARYMGISARASASPHPGLPAKRLVDFAELCLRRNIRNLLLLSVSVLVHGIFPHGLICVAMLLICLALLPIELGNILSFAFVTYVLLPYFLLSCFL